MERKNKKRTTVLILLIIFLFLGMAGFFYYLYVGSKQIISKANRPEKGRWRLATTDNPSEKEEAYQKMLTLGYLKGYNTAPKLKDVTIFDNKLTYNGLNFCVSAHAPEAFLMSMEGKILHTWRYRLATEIWPDAPKNDPENSYWRRAFLYRNGDVLAIYANCGMIKIDRDSKLIWTYNLGKKPHHDLEVTDDGYIYMLTREEKIIPWIDEKRTVREDFITILDHDGKIVKNISLLNLMAKSKYKRLLDGRIKAPDLFTLSQGDIFHTNTLEVLDGKLAGKSPLFKKGNLLISLFTIDTIAIIDHTSEEIIWALGSGMWKRQHQPTLLENGNILIFDNWYTENSSKVIEFNPFTQEISWEYGGNDKNKFYSQFCGSNQRLPNGNTLITETDNGRAFEVTRKKQIVWEFINPHRAGKNNELIASLPEVIRVKPEYCAYIKYDK